MTTARTPRPETQPAVAEVAPQRPCSHPAPAAAVALLAVAVLVAACDSRESVSFTRENATDRFNSLVAARAADRSDRGPGEQGVDTAPASPSWTTPQQPPSLTLALTDGLPSELEFSVGVRSVRHVSTRTDALRVGVDGDIVAWTRPEPDSSGTLHFSLFHNPELLGHGDDADLWPAAVALEALRSFLRPSGTRFGIVVSLLDISTSSHAAAVPWVYPRTGNDPRTAATTAYAADQPQLPLLVADRPGWVVAVLPPAGRDPSHSDDLLPLHLRISRFLSSLRARSTPPPYSDVITSGAPIQVLDTYFPLPRSMDTAAVSPRGEELERLLRSIDNNPTEELIGEELTKRDSVDTRAGPEKERFAVGGWRGQSWNHGPRQLRRAGSGSARVFGSGSKDVVGRSQHVQLRLRGIAAAVHDARAPPRRGGRPPQVQVEFWSFHFLEKG